MADQEKPASLHSRQEHVDDITRSLPHAVGPEKSVLSSMLQDPVTYIAKALEMGVTEDHFYLPSHALLFKELCEMTDRNEEIELVMLVQKLLDRGKLDRIGGPATLTDIYTYSPSSGSFVYHVNSLKEKHLLRGIIQTCNAGIAGSYDNPEDPMATLDAIESEFSRMRDLKSTSNTAPVKKTMPQVISDMQDLVNGVEKAKGISTGFTDLDAKGIFMKAGDMFVIGARPSQGKTAIMLNIVDHICVDQNVPTVVFSAEMTNVQIINRMVFARARFSYSSLMQGKKPDKGDLLRIQRASVQINEAPLTTDDTAGITLTELRAKARKLRKEGKCGFIAIDYLQLMKDNSKQSQASREREIATISAGIKALAKELGIPIIILAQINRGPDKQTGKSKGRPRMSDLRESGSIEADADMIALLFRPEYYAVEETEKKELEGIAELIIDKNRNGETGSVHLTFLGEIMRFVDASRTPEPT